MKLKNRLKGCLICGTIGDSIGGQYEGTDSNEIVDLKEILANQQIRIFVGLLTKMMKHILAH